MMKFGQLILGKIIKIVATNCQILRLKCIKTDFGWGSAPHPTRGAYNAVPDSLAGINGTYFKEKGIVQGGEGKERKRKWEKRRGKGKGETRKWRGPVCIFKFP